MKLWKRREFLWGLGLGSLGLFSLLKWDTVYGYVTSISASTGAKPEEQPSEEPVVPEMDCDYVLENGLIVDGTGQAGFLGNIGIKGDTIVAVGDFLAGENAKKMNASGLVITPGFIDLHTHTEDYWLAGGDGEMVLKQGVTTQIGGNCGSSVSSIGDYLASLHQAPINVGLFVGYKNLRRSVVPDQVKEVGGAEIGKMQMILAKGLEEGAFGLSVGLSYDPQIKATKDELIQLCRTVKEGNGFYSTHIRNENDEVIPSVQEAISIGLSAQVPVEYSHVKTAGQRNWGKMAQVLKLVEQAANDGLDITGDTYPYTYSSLDVAQNDQAESMCEEDMNMALQHPLIMVGSDSGLSQEGVATHPRAYGNYTRVLSHYVRDTKLLGLEQAVHKMTLMPARRLKLKDRGMIAVGHKADLAVFNLSGVAEQATRDKPNQTSLGMKYVFVNGGLALDQGAITGVKTGRPLKNQL
ncbi:N-acyl-D-amino-acid deacylase family protein [Candidatus Formimonas warabiya]|uniref:Amidohydrolase-related domain-containing protein n=1 Tax=Formimonas warabiya TaxID=1761012 RepID=A0A3G1KXB4_FORW1|nr:D-aminoacylase [Candidatus Formimonas warabiya]ATW27060.1 hypothetical protein DCMF_21900 [Candidatus Formimonas warabiya]